MYLFICLWIKTVETVQALKIWRGFSTGLSEIVCTFFGQHNEES